jgi:hypothetical protein
VCKCWLPWRHFVVCLGKVMSHLRRRQLQEAALRLQAIPAPTGCQGKGSCDPTTGDISYTSGACSDSDDKCKLNPTCNTANGMCSYTDKVRNAACTRPVVMQRWHVCVGDASDQLSIRCLHSRVSKVTHAFHLHAAR